MNEVLVNIKVKGTNYWILRIHILSNKLHPKAKLFDRIISILSPSSSTGQGEGDKGKRGPCMNNKNI